MPCDSFRRSVDSRSSAFRANGVEPFESHCLSLTCNHVAVPFLFQTRNLWFRNPQSHLRRPQLASLPGRFNGKPPSGGSY